MVPPIATLSDVATAAPWAFIAGMGIGFVLANRYRISRRDPDMEKTNGHDPARPPRTTRP